MNLRNGRGTQEELDWSKRRGNDVNTVIIHAIINQINLTKRKCPLSTHSAHTPIAHAIQWPPSAPLWKQKPILYWHSDFMCSNHFLCSEVTKATQHRDLWKNSKALKTKTKTCLVCNLLNLQRDGDALFNRIFPFCLFMHASSVAQAFFKNTDPLLFN